MLKPLHYHEDELVHLLKQNDKHAFSYLYDNYYQAIWNTIEQVVCKEEDINDVLQEVYTKIWLQFSQYSKERGRLFTWMATITRNHCRDFVTSKSYKTVQRHDELTSDLFIYGGEYIIRTDGIYLWEIISKLKPKYKELITMYYFYGYNQWEISVLLNMPVGTVKTRLGAGIKQLKIIML